MTDANNLLPLYRASALGWCYDYLAVPWEHLNLSGYPTKLFQHHNSGPPPLGLQEIKDTEQIVPGAPRPWGVSPEGDELLRNSPPSIRDTISRIRGVVNCNRSFPRVINCKRLTEIRANRDQVELAKFISRTKMALPTEATFEPTAVYDRALNPGRYQNLINLYADMHILTVDAEEGKMIK